MLLDEPTAGLNPVARREFHDQLKLLQRERGTTVFFSSHLVGEVEQLAQRVGIVQAGQTRFEGDVVALRACGALLPIQPLFRAMDLNGCDPMYTVPVCPADNLHAEPGDIFFGYALGRSEPIEFTPLEGRIQLSGDYGFEV